MFLGQSVVDCIVNTLLNQSHTVNLKLTMEEKSVADIYFYRLVMDEL